MRAAETTISTIIAILTLFIFHAAEVTAQSLDVSAPTPIPTSSVVGHISARDIGDARFTDHFYAFVGNPGDLLIIVESRNLNGDVDVFTAAGLRPLLKFTVYAESSASISKSIFLRRRQELILRIQARTPNDDEGIYQIRFGGTFEAVAGPPTLAETEEDVNAATAATPKRGRRVSSVGARIIEPEPPVQELASAAPTPEPTPEATPAELAPAETKPEEMKPAEVETATTPPSRSTRTRRPSSRRSTSRTRTPERSEETTTPPESPTEEEPRRPASNRRGSSRRESTPPERPKETVEQEVPTGPQLIIETVDGTLINRPMSSLRRVLVEGGVVVIVAKDGGVQRVRLTQIVRMLITP